MDFSMNEGIFGAYVTGSRSQVYFATMINGRPFSYNITSIAGFPNSYSSVTVMPNGAAVMIGKFGTLGDRSVLSQIMLVTPCGDGRIQYPEVCDDGNNISGDGCDSTCLNETSTTSSSSTSPHDIMTTSSSSSPMLLVGLTILMVLLL